MPNNTTQLMEELDEILESMACKDCMGYPNQEHAEAIDKLTKLIALQETKARIGMVEYYDQCSDNKDMNWKGLFSDNRKLLEHELAQLNPNTDRKKVDV